MEDRLCTRDVILLLEAEDMDVDDFDELDDEPVCEYSDDSLGVELSDDER